VDVLPGLGSYLRELVADTQVPGAVLAISPRPGEVEVAAAGVADQRSGRPLTAETVFAVGSMAKVVTAAVAMQLVDEGRLDLDRAVADYLPDLRLPEAVPASALTPRHLLTHTSGLDGWPAAVSGKEEPTLQAFPGLCDAVATLAPPGRLYSYWHGGYVLLARLVEVLDRGSWPEALEARVRRPLGLADTIFTREDVRARVHTRGHVQDPGGGLMPMPFLTLPPYRAPSGGLWMSAGDLLAVGRLLLDGTARDGRRLLSGATLAAMRQPLVEYPDRSVTDAWGLGLALISPDHRLVGFSGAYLGHLSFLRLVPDRGFAMVLLVNASTGEDVETALSDRFLAGHLGVRLPPAPGPVAGAPATPDVDGCAGVFRRSEFEVVIGAGDGGLTVSTRPLAPRFGRPRTWKEVPLARVDDAHCFPAPPRTAMGNSFVFLDAAGSPFAGRGRAEYVQFRGKAHRRVAGPD